MCAHTCVAFRYGEAGSLGMKILSLFTRARSRKLQEAFVSQVSHFILGRVENQPGTGKGKRSPGEQADIRRPPLLELYSHVWAEGVARRCLLRGALMDRGAVCSQWERAGVAG